MYWKSPYLGVTAVMTATVTDLASATVDTPPKSGGVHRLKPDIYAPIGVSCTSVPNVVAERYDGRGLSTAHTRACRERILSIVRSRHVAAQSCIANEARQARQTVERQNVVVSDALSFKLRTPDSRSTCQHYAVNLISPEFGGWRNDAW